MPWNNHSSSEASEPTSKSSVAAAEVRSSVLGLNRSRVLSCEASRLVLINECGLFHFLPLPTRTPLSAESVPRFRAKSRNAEPGTCRFGKTLEPYHPGFVAEWAADWKIAWEAATPLMPVERKRLAYLEQSTVTLHRLLNRDEHWAALAAIVDSLLAHETLEGEKVEDLVSHWLRNRMLARFITDRK